MNCPTQTRSPRKIFTPIFRSATLVFMSGRSWLLRTCVVLPLFITSVTRADDGLFARLGHKLIDRSDALERENAGYPGCVGPACGCGCMVFLASTALVATIIGGCVAHIVDAPDPGVLAGLGSMVGIVGLSAFGLRRMARRATDAEEARRTTLEVGAQSFYFLEELPGLLTRKLQYADEWSLALSSKEISWRDYRDSAESFFRALSRSFQGEIRSAEKFAALGQLLRDSRELSRLYGKLESPPSVEEWNKVYQEVVDMADQVYDRRLHGSRRVFKPADAENLIWKRFIDRLHWQ